MQEETPDAYADGDHDCEPVSERDSIHDGGRLTSDDEFYTNIGAGGIFGASTAITVYRESDVAAAVDAVKQKVEMRAYNARDRKDNRKYNAYMKAIVIVNDCFPAVTGQEADEIKVGCTSCLGGERSDGYGEVKTDSASCLGDDTDES